MQNGSEYLAVLPIHYSRSTWLQRLREESIITVDRNIHFGRGLKRLKAEIEGFPTAQTASKAEITTQSYDRFLSRRFGQVIRGHCN